MHTAPCVTTLHKKLPVQDSCEHTKPPSKLSLGQHSGQGDTVMAVLAGAKARCLSDRSDSTVVCRTVQERFSQKEPEIMIYINGLSNKLAKIDAPTWCSRYAAFPVFLPLSYLHRLGAQDFESKGLTLFYLTIGVIHSPTQLSHLVVLVSSTLTKLCIPREQGHTEKHLQAVQETSM